MQPDRGIHRSKLGAFLAHLFFTRLLVLLCSEISIIAADTCSFENGICSEWISTNCSIQGCFVVRKVADMNNGPAEDHTLKTDQGSSAYATLNGTKGTWSNIAELTQKTTGPLCITAWFHLSGTESGQASFIVHHSSSIPKEFYRTRPHLAGQWQQVRYSEKRPGAVEISIRYDVKNSPEKGLFCLDDLTVKSGECPPEPNTGSCDFDWDDACGYDLRSGTRKWLLEGRERKKFFFADYSTNSVQGGLMYVEATENTSPLAGFSSPKLAVQTTAQCLQFNYYLPYTLEAPDGASVMSVAVKGQQRSRLVWERHAEELLQGEWTPVDIRLNLEKNSKVQFWCYLKSVRNSQSYCAIDAIRLRDCKGSTALGDSLCDFEDGWCSWRNKDEWSNKPAWQLVVGTMKTTLSRPLQDHTLANSTSAGSYLFFSNYQRKKGDKAELVGELLPQSSRITLCTEFWYSISGDDATRLEVLAVGPRPIEWKNTPLWGQHGGSSSKWLLGRVAVPHGKRVVFRGTVGRASTPAYIALDDILIGHNDRCETFPQEAESLSAADLLSCKFRGLDLCHWLSSGVPSEVWKFGMWFPSDLGPSSSPKNAEGGMVYITGTSLESGRGTVQLQSPVVGPQTEHSCFSVWYHMFAGRGATLSLSVSKPDTARPGQWRSSLLFKQKGRTTADQWQNVRRTVDLNGVHNKFTFTVTNAPSMRKAALVALGPLKFTSGACDVLTDGEGYCDFEFDMCTWTTAKGWQRQQKQNSAMSVEGLSGPVNSVYVMTATQKASSSTGAELRSPEWRGQSEPRCLEFWYRSAGNNSSQLQVEIIVNGTSDVIWRKSSYPESEWMLVRTQIMQEKNFKVLFRAKFLADSSESVSLDDVVLRPEQCVHPAECDFSEGLCGYVNKFKGDFRWLVGPGRLEDRWQQPSWPLLQGRSSSFAYLDFTTGSTDRDLSKTSQRRIKAVGLLSPLFHVTNDYTSLSLKYFRGEGDITSANLSVSCFGDTDRGNVQLDRELGEVTTWALVNVTLKRGTNCQLAVWVVRGDGTKGAMAIDAVQVTTSKQDVQPIPSSNSPTQCTFEEGIMCGWRSTSTSVKWALNDPSKKIPNFPRFDHTVKAYRGRFIFASNEDIAIKTASLESPDLDVNVTNGACLSLWMFTVHTRNNKFTVLAGGEITFSTSARASHRWEHVLVDLKKREEKFQILIKATFGHGLVALDDIQVNSGFCTTRDFCSWEEGSHCLTVSSPESFSFWRPRRASLFGFPDHTLQSLEGHYLYLNTTGVDSHHPVARVFLPTRPPTEATCVTFWWNARGATSQLNVYRFTKETALQDPLVSVSTAERSVYWIPSTVTVSSRSRWNLVFEGVVATGVMSDSGIMLDDVEFTDGECPPYNLCTFEDECLPWEIPTTGDEAAFEVERAGSFDNLPQDHTTQTVDGYYLLFKSPAIEGNQTSMVLRNPYRYDCLSLWYYLPALTGGVKLIMTYETVSQGKGVWKRQQIRYPSQWSIPISAVSGGNAGGFVAIDDVLLNEEECSALTRTTETFHCGTKTITLARVCDFVPDCDDGADERDCGGCNFSEGSCGWKLEDKLNSYNTAWRRKPIGDVPAAPPAGADGRRNGYYLLLSSNGLEMRKPDRAIIESPKVRNTNTLCTLHFWYNYIHNGTPADVDLFMTVGAYKFPVWSLSALSKTPAEGTWNEAIVHVGRYSRDVSFTLSGSRYSKAQPMFAVDLIDYKGCALPAKEENCSNFAFQCANGACVALYARCNYVDDCGDSSDEKDCGDFRLGCNFDTSFCDWAPQVPSEGKNTWILGHPSSFLMTAPGRDHTTGTPKGRFLLLRSGYNKTVSTVIGHTLSNNDICAISFFYTIQGQADSELKLVIRTTKDGPWKIVWKQSNSTEFFHFIEATVVFSEGAPFQVAFIGEYKKPSTREGYIAIDDVTFWETCKPYHEQLPAAPVPTAPPSLCRENEFECSGSRQCISLSQVCDFNADCSDGADESRCGACDFSTDLCGLQNVEPNARFGWNWTTAQDGKNNKLFPTTDSQLNYDGAYAAFSLMNPSAPQGHAKSLVTPPLGQIAHSCVVSFYAYVPDEDRSALYFDVLPPSSRKPNRAEMAPLASIHGTMLKSRWAKVTVRVGNWIAGSRFIYQASRVGVSIDRVEYMHCHPDTLSEGWEATQKVSCDFSSSGLLDCGWFPERMVTDAKWVLLLGESVAPTLRWQPADSASHKGAYVYARNMFSNARTAHLVSVKMAPTRHTGRCFTFWYNMWHPNAGQLNLLLRVENTSRVLVWSRAGPQGKSWKQGEVQLQSEYPHQLVFEAILIGGSPGMIAIDNFVLKDSACDTRKECTFESGTCGWQLHNWKQTSGSSVVLPQIDYSTQSPTGRFALALSPDGRMVSPVGWYDPSRHKCLRFWFFISGCSDEALNVTLTADDLQDESVWFATKADAPAQKWFSAAVALPNHRHATNVVFEGMTSGDPGAAVAVDDISLREAACPSPGSCTFEEDMCNWYNSKDLSYAQWYRHSGNTVSNSTGIDKDHTVATKDGFYLLLDAEDMAKYRVGILQSEIISMGPTVCLRLFYFMKRTYGARLTISFFNETGLPFGGPTFAVGVEPSRWTLLSVESSDVPPRFSIRITGETGRRIASDVAIDDIDVRSGKCEPAPLPRSSSEPAVTASPSSASPGLLLRPSTPEATVTTSTPEEISPTSGVSSDPTTSEIPNSRPSRPLVQCTRGQFNCRDGMTCIPGVLLCDGVRDCPNGLDEKCGTASYCKDDEFYCSSHSPSSCLPRSLLCDGHEDCSGGSDEFMCRECPRHFCQNNAICGWTPLAPYPACDCSLGYQGRRCELSADPLLDKQPVTERPSTGPVVAGVIVVLVVIILAVVLTVVFLRRRRVATDTAMILDNPTYNASTNETRLFN